MASSGILVPAVFAAISLGATIGPVRTADGTSSNAARTVFDFEARSIGGEPVSLGQYRGKVLLIVNTASRCGFTPQYEGLETLYERYHERGFEVLGFPANDFLGQEPGTDTEIETFCTTRFGTRFPLFSKIHVKGKSMHPLYAWLTTDSGQPGAIKWNFTKFLVGADGRVIARFEPNVTPLAQIVTSAIEAALPAR